MAAQGAEGRASGALGGSVLSATRHELLLRTRPAKGLLGGMSEFPGTLWSEDYTPTNALRDAPLIADYHCLDAKVTHQFTHFTLTLDIFVADVGPAKAAARLPLGQRY